MPALNSLWPLTLLYFCVTLGVSQVAVGSENPLKVSVYYETRCPDSIRFIVDQLYPVFLRIPEYINIDLVPYGNAKTKVNPNGTYTFACQHGPKECAGNKVHACAIKHIPKPSRLMAYVNCTIASKNVVGYARRCAIKNNIPYRGLATCATTSEGDQLLYQYGERTKSLSPKVTWVPWVTINDVFYKEDFDMMEKNLLRVICKYLSDPKPSVCSSQYRYRSRG